MKNILAFALAGLLAALAILYIVSESDHGTGPRPVVTHGPGSPRVDTPAPTPLLARDGSTSERSSRGTTQANASQDGDDDSRRIGDDYPILARTVQFRGRPLGEVALDDVPRDQIRSLFFALQDRAFALESQIRRKAKLEGADYLTSAEAREVFEYSPETYLVRTRIDSLDGEGTEIAYVAVDEPIPDEFRELKLLSIEVLSHPTYRSLLGPPNKSDQVVRWESRHNGIQAVGYDASGSVVVTRSLGFIGAPMY
ncbi:MAG: hypothetical protein R3F34_18990 [Planctomycetota bacterium]